MGTLVETSTLRAMILEILSKDKTLMMDIFETIFSENPQLIEEYTSKNALAIESEAKVYNSNRPDTIMPFQVTEDSIETQNPKTEGISDEELNFWVDKHFNEYDAVFKALA